MRKSLKFDFRDVNGEAKQHRCICENILKGPVLVTKTKGNKTALSQRQSQK
jgi:hypothetical protein